MEVEELIYNSQTTSQKCNPPMWDNEIYNSQNSSPNLHPPMWDNGKIKTNANNLKPSNVLLDEDMVAHISDFGISKLLGEDEHDLYTKTLATLGYIAPEYGLDGLVSIKCDVYSYGIMLLETFTRRKPNEFEGDISLKHWVSYSFPEAVMDVVDANLITTSNRLQKELDVVASIMKVALDCCAESPARRTNMKDVVGILQKIMIQLLAC